MNAIFAGAFSESEGYLLLSQHTAYNPKLLILRDATPNDNNLVENEYNADFLGGFANVSASGVPSSECMFNYPFWFNELADNNLYTLFHYIKNPRLPGTQKFDFEFEFAFNCEEYDGFSFEKSVEIIKNGVVELGVPLQVVTNFNRRTIKVNGIV